MDIPAKQRQHFKDLFGWLNGDQVETRRSTKEKAPKKIKDRANLHGSIKGEVAGILQDNAKREEIKQPAQEAGETAIEQGTQPGGSSCEGRLQGLRELPVRLPEPDGLSQAIYCPSVPAVRTESAPTDNTRSAVENVSHLQEQAMKEEYDESYEQTTAHSCITCKCGTKVWYGCGVKQLTRPKYCRACEKKERSRITASYQGKVDNQELYRILEWETRRGINK